MTKPRRNIRQRFKGEMTLRSALRDEAPFAIEPNEGPRPTSGGRGNTSSRRFMVQLLSPNFCWHPLQTRPPRGRSGHAIGFSNQWRTQWQTRRRIRALIPGKK
jgi:hypothetical protein